MEAKEEAKAEAKGKAAKKKATNVHKAGKRKTALARTTVKEGSGIIRVNSFNLSQVSDSMIRLRIEEPLLLAKGIIDPDAVDINILVNGGGVSGQANAIRTSVARALVEFAPSNKREELKDIFIKYDRTLIAGDSRRTEPHKPCGSTKGPRARRQKSYR